MEQALIDAIGMLEHIARGGDYNASVYYAAIARFEKALNDRGLSRAYSGAQWQPTGQIRNADVLDSDCDCGTHLDGAA